MSDPRDTSWPDGQGRALDDAGRELASALDDARERLPDDMTMRRMWERARVSQLELADAAPPARTPRWIWFAGGVASTAALAFAFVTWHGPRRDGALANAPKPTTTVVAPTATTESTAMPAPEGTVRTGAGERLALALAGGAEARLAASSVLTVAHDGHAVVDGGEVSFTVTRRERARPYVVMAGPYRVVVLGARFRLSLDETKRVRVDAEDGVAEVWDQGRLARLGAGESWTSPAGAPASTTTTPHARAVALTDPGADAAGDPEARARAALAAGDVTRALGLYRALAKRGGPASENAAYEVGKVLRDRLGQPANAVAAWRRYRVDHPDGILRVETDVSIIETLVHAGDTGAALTEANDFLRHHPDSERRAEIARVAGDLYRVRGDLQRAVAAYQVALASPKSRDAEPAMFHRAECLVRLGDPSGNEAARDYLRRWPEGRFRAEAERLLAGRNDDGTDDGTAHL
jgi:ferric-dicitrate binding protein FerR (iron transport regulator)